MTQRRRPDAPGPEQPNPMHHADTRNPDWDSYVPHGHGHTDEQIRADVHECLSKELDSLAGTLVITVAHGTVTLQGQVDDQARHRRIVELIRSVPSVQDVRDELHVQQRADLFGGHAP